MSRPDPAAAGRASAADVEPVAPPRHATLWAALVYALATLLLAWPALAGRFLVNEHSDQFIAGFPFREFQARFIEQYGTFPLWNPYLFGGLPYVAGMHGDLFYPTFLLRLVMSPDAGMTWGMILHVFLAGLLSFAFLRGPVGLSFLPALVGGLAFMMGGNVAGLVSPGHDGKIFLSALLPLTLLLVHRAVRGGRAWAWGALALVITLAVLTPHPQLLQYLLLVAGAYALFCAYTADHDGVRLARNTALGRLGLAAVAVGVGLLGGAIQFWPVFEYTAWSPRAGGKGWDHATSYSLPPEELLNAYLPQFTGILDSYWGRNGIHFHSDYVGATVLVLAGLAFGVSGAWRRRQLWFWAGALLVSTLWALGGFTPFYRLVYALVPGTKYFRAPSTMLYVVQFCGAVLAALGAERLLARAARPRYAYAWLGVAAVVGVLGATGALTNLGASLALPQLAPRVDANAGAVAIGAWRSFLAVAVVCALLLAVHRGALRPRLAGLLLAGVVALDLWSIVRLYWRFSPPAAQLYASDPVVDYLRQHASTGRVIPLAIEPLTGATRDPYFGSGDGRGGGFMVHRVRSAVGYHGNEIGRYQQLSGWTTDWPRQVGNPNFWRLANVRYLYTNTPTPPLEGMRRVAGPVRNVAGNMAYLYEFPGENPPAWVTPLAVEAPDESVLGTVLDPRFDVRRAALFDTSAAVPTQPVPPELPEPLDLPVRVRRWDPGHIALSLERPAPAGATLMVSENFYPGWTATADGRAAALGRADYTLIGVALPAGAREIELRFTSPRYETGKAITLLALAVSALAALGGLVLERRRRA